MCSDHAYHIIQNVLWTLDVYFGMLFLFCFIAKFWLLRYNIKLHAAVLGNEWKSVINAQRHEHRQSFYVRYRTTLGNYQWIMWASAIIATLSTSVYEPYFLVHWHHNCEWEFYMDLVNLLPFILLIVLYFLTPSFEDNFYIRKEMMYIFFCLCLSYCSWYTFYIIKHVTGFDYDTESLTYELTNAVSHGSFNFGQFAAIMVSTLWVNRRCDRIIERKQYQIHKVSKSQGVVGTQETFDIAPKSQKVEEQMEDIRTRRKLEVQMRIGVHSDSL